MTQHTELIARLSGYERGDAADIVWEAADKIRALEVEIDALAHHLNRQKQWKGAMRDKMKALEAENSANMATCKGIIQGLQVERDAKAEMVIKLQALLDGNMALNERWQAQLAAAQGQSPVGFIANYGDNSGSLPPMAGVAWVNEIPPIGTKLYAATIPQQPAEPAQPASKPLTDDQINVLWETAIAIADPTSGNLRFKLARAVETAHGIKQGGQHD